MQRHCAYYSRRPASLSTPAGPIMVCAGAAGVYTELIMKRMPKRNVNVQNIYLCGLRPPPRCTPRKRPRTRPPPYSEPGEAFGGGGSVGGPSPEAQTLDSPHGFIKLRRVRTLRCACFWPNPTGVGWRSSGRAAQRTAAAHPPAPGSTRQNPAAPDRTRQNPTEPSRTRQTPAEPGKPCGRIAAPLL